MSQATKDPSLCFLLAPESVRFLFMQIAPNKKGTHRGQGTQKEIQAHTQIQRPRMTSEWQEAERRVDPVGRRSRTPSPNN